MGVGIGSDGAAPPRPSSFLGEAPIRMMLTSLATRNRLTAQGENMRITRSRWPTWWIRAFIREDHGATCIEIAQSLRSIDGVLDASELIATELKPVLENLVERGYLAERERRFYLSGPWIPFDYWSWARCKTM